MLTSRVKIDMTTHAIQIAEEAWPGKDGFVVKVEVDGGADPHKRFVVSLSRSKAQSRGLVNPQGDMTTSLEQLVKEFLSNPVNLKRLLDQSQASRARDADRFYEYPLVDADHPRLRK